MLMPGTATKIFSTAVWYGLSRDASPSSDRLVIGILILGCVFKRSSGIQVPELGRFYQLMAKTPLIELEYFVASAPRSV